MTVLGSVLVFLLSAGLLTCLIFLFLSIRRPAAPAGKPPAWRPRTLLDEEQRALFADLLGVCDKLGLHLFCKVALGEVLDMSSPSNKSWAFRLQALPVDFLIAEGETDVPKLVLFLEQKSGPADDRADVTAALEASGLQHMVLRSYNLPGLEKAIREKVRPGSGRKRPGSKEKYEAEQVDHAQAEA